MSISAAKMRESIAADIRYLTPPTMAEEIERTITLPAKIEQDVLAFVDGAWVAKVEFGLAVKDEGELRFEKQG